MAEREPRKKRPKRPAKAGSGKTDGEGEAPAGVGFDLVAGHVQHHRLEPRAWYGMPAYSKDGKVVCHFQSGQNFKMRYAMLGFRNKAALDEGALWPVAYAITELTPEVEARIAELVKKATG